MTMMSPEFKMAYIKLGEQPMKVETHMKYRQIGTQIEKHLTESAELQLKLLDQLALKNEKGEIEKELDESGAAIGYKWINQDHANGKFKDFSLAELEVDGVHPFFVYELSDAKMSSKEWTALTELMGDPSNLPA